MIDECPVTPSLQTLADIFSEPGGFRPERLRSLSCQAPKPVASLIQMVLSSSGEQMQKSLASLAGDLSASGSAADWLDLGRIAAGLFYRRAAEEYFERSAEIARNQGDEEGRSKALSALAGLYSEDEDWDRACRCYEAALASLDEVKSKPLIISVLVNLGGVYRQRGDLSQAENCYCRILRLAGDGISSMRADAQYFLGDMLRLKGDSSGALMCYEKSLADREKLQDGKGMVRSLSALSVVHRHCGAAVRAESCLLTARRLLKDQGDLCGAASMSLLLGDLFFEQGQFREAAEHYQKGFFGIEGVNFPLAAQAMARAGQCFLETGELALSENHLKRAAEIMRREESTTELADLLEKLAGLCRIQGRPNEALQYAQESLAIREGEGEASSLAAALSLAGLICSDLRRWPQGIECFQRAADLLLESGNALSAAEALSNLGSLYHLQGDLDGALECYSRSLRIYGEHGNSQGCSQTESNLGLIYQVRGDLALAEEFVARPGEPSWRIAWHRNGAVTAAEATQLKWREDPPIR